MSKESKEKKLSTTAKLLIAVSVISLIAAIAGVWLIDYLNIGDKIPGFGEAVVLDPDIDLEDEEESTGKPKDPVPYKIESVAQELFVPWSIVFTSKNRMLVSERDGAIRIIKNGKLQKSPLATFPDVATSSEEGLMGLTKSPNYDNDKYLYACLAYNEGDKIIDKVIRFKDKGSSISTPEIILDDIPAARFHAGCRLKFGPDDKLYITTGDATDGKIAQDKNSLGGKILRLNKDGSIPDDNPFGSPVWTLGHRNPQGLAWQPTTGALFSTEHGPSGFDGPGGGDEINVIEKGKNYGWPTVSHDNNKPGLTPPIVQFTPAVAPGSAMFYDGNVFPQFQNQFFFGGLAGNGVYRVVLTDKDSQKVGLFQRLQKINVGRVREVTQGPDGYIYFTTSNQDGRGPLKVGDDHVYRIIPDTKE